jgi:hypothetical protein
VLFWRWYRAGDPRGWVLPVAVAAELGWATFLWSGYRGFLPWVLPVAITAGGAAIIVLGLARLSHRARTRLATAGLAAAVAAMLAAPAAWAASVLDVRYAGSSFDASAGPASGFGGGGGFGAGFGPGAVAAAGGASEPQQIAAWVETSCTTVPAQAYGGTPIAAAPGRGPFAGSGGTSTLYECTTST